MEGEEEGALPAKLPTLDLALVRKGWAGASLWRAVTFPAAEDKLCWLLGPGAGPSCSLRCSFTGSFPAGGAPLVAASSSF